jgi:hypothetical protein
MFIFCKFFLNFFIIFILIPITSILAIAIWGSLLWFISNLLRNVPLVGLFFNFIYNKLNKINSF